VNLPEYETMFRVEERYWWYRGMRRIAQAFAPELFHLPPSARLLDAGCGTGANLAHVAGRGGGPRGFGADLSFEALHFCRRRGLARFAEGTLERLPFRDASFDAVTCHDVLISVADDGSALRELARVAKPGGILYVTAAAFDAFQGEQDRASHGLRRYTAREMSAKVEAAGFRVSRTSYANFFLALPIFIVRRVQDLLVRGRPAGEARSEFHLTPGLLNGPLTALLGLEAALIERLRLPVGVTLLLKASKPIRGEG
jgi:ubiquinone/menaquinone biosynthesis C-methylase UbiE